MYEWWLWLHTEDKKKQTKRCYHYHLWDRRTNWCTAAKKQRTWSRKHVEKKLFYDFSHSLMEFRCCNRYKVAEPNPDFAFDFDVENCFSLMANDIFFLRNEQKTFCCKVLYAILITSFVRLCFYIFIKCTSYTRCAQTNVCGCGGAIFCPFVVINSENDWKCTPNQTDRNELKAETNALIASRDLYGSYIIYITYQVSSVNKIWKPITEYIALLKW